MHEESKETIDDITKENPASLQKYTWDTSTDYARCFLHKVTSTVKGGLEELGRPAPSRARESEGLLGVFPFSGTLPVIAEDDEDALENTTIVIDDDNDNNVNILPVPEEANTDHDSADEKDLEVAPDYDEENENQLD
ncbi:uncharacterized protein MELLADRAFT_107935 [Melampsora larici-populina 98AG31]|uniref:Uncharacterized protein n=1 Tax=Melampsora larici-populina (strain 98AG31 / pathotype 3-4-7) TaxID=747676 RepID=F4RRF8_MELLP|nr:uncharacterized protein MELLADRAFT_107935 [Melampsora larici-populina 98AG31]EGG04930.1 hypothetical protein MELLADRAFT_107935 [Melampsora larici-populina 98AG31]